MPWLRTLGRMCQNRILVLTQIPTWRSVSAVQTLGDLGAKLAVRRASTGKRSGRKCMTLQLKPPNEVKVEAYGKNRGTDRLGRRAELF
jgi:hypothetical protein